MKNTYLNTVIKGTGSFIPNNIIINDHFLNHSFYDDKSKKIPNNNQVIIKKFQKITEIEERRYADDNIMASDMAAIAAEKAIKDANINREDLDYIIVGHNFSDVTIENNQTKYHLMPSVSAKVKQKLGIKNTACIPYDMSFGCPGWLQGVIMAHQFIKTKLAKKILVIGSDTLSRVVDEYDRNCMIFADGASATVLSGVEENEQRGVLDYGVICNNAEELNYLETGKSVCKEEKTQDNYIKMQGRKIYEYALLNVPSAIKDTMDKSNLHINDVSKLLIHQANAKMDEAILNRLKKCFGVTEVSENFMPMTIQKLGNSSVATVPTMLDLILKGQLKPHQINKGDNLVFASVGAGMFINAVTYKV